MNTQEIFIIVSVLLVIIFLIVFLVKKKKSKEGFSNKLNRTFKGSGDDPTPCSSFCKKGVCDSNNNCVCSSISCYGGGPDSDCNYLCGSTDVCLLGTCQSNPVSQGIDDFNQKLLQIQDMVNTNVPILLNAINELVKIVRTTRAQIEDAVENAKETFKNVKETLKTGLFEKIKDILKSPSEKFAAKKSAVMKTFRDMTDANKLQEVTPEDKASFMESFRLKTEIPGKYLTEGKFTYGGLQKCVSDMERFGEYKRLLLGDTGGVINPQNIYTGLAGIYNNRANTLGVPYVINVRTTEYYITQLSLLKGNTDILVARQSQQILNPSDPQEFPIPSVISYLTPLLTANGYSSYGLIYPGIQILHQLANPDFKSQKIYGSINNKVQLIQNATDVSNMDIQIGFTTFYDTNFYWHSDDEVKSLIQTILIDQIVYGSYNIQTALDSGTDLWVYTPMGGFTCRDPTSNDILGHIPAGVQRLNDFEKSDSSYNIIVAYKDYNTTAFNGMHMATLQNSANTVLNVLPDSSVSATSVGGNVYIQDYENDTTVFLNAGTDPDAPDPTAILNPTIIKAASYSVTKGQYVAYCTDQSGNVWQAIYDRATFWYPNIWTNDDPSRGVVDIKVIENYDGNKDDLVFILLSNGDPSNTGYKIAKANYHAGLTLSELEMQTTEIIRMYPLILSDGNVRVYCQDFKTSQISQDIIVDGSNVQTNVIINEDSSGNVISYSCINIDTRTYVYRLITSNNTNRLNQIQIDSSPIPSPDELIGTNSIDIMVPDSSDNIYQMTEICYIVKAHKNDDGTIRIFLVGISGLAWMKDIDPTDPNKNPDWQPIFDPSGGDIKDIGQDASGNIFYFTNVNRLTGFGSQMVQKYTTTGCKYTAGTPQCVNCTDDKQCPSGQRCSCSNQPGGCMSAAYPLHTCVECISQAECDVASNKPFCDINNTFTCKQCLQDSHCFNPGEKCDDSGTCSKI